MTTDTKLTNIIYVDITEGIANAILDKPENGPSTYVTSLARRLGARTFVLPCSLVASRRDLGDVLTGHVHPVIKGAMAHAEAHPDEEPILLIDELEHAIPAVSDESLFIAAHRAINGKDLPDNLRIVVASNGPVQTNDMDHTALARLTMYRVPTAQTEVTLFVS